LKDACEKIFAGAISVATLMAEHRRRNLIISKIGRQYFTTLRDLEDMRTKCTVEPPVRRLRLATADHASTPEMRWEAGMAILRDGPNKRRDEPKTKTKRPRGT
jgi:hypothetical protein